MSNVHRLHRIVVASRDTCNGACQESAGCDCCGQWPETIPVQPAEACTDLGAEPRGMHRDSALTRFALWLRRVLG